MFRRDGLPARLLTVVLTIAVAWAISPVAGFGADVPGTQGQEVASAGAAAENIDAESSQLAGSAETSGNSSATDGASEESGKDSVSESSKADAKSAGLADDAGGSNEEAAETGSADSGKAVAARAPSAEAEDAESTEGKSSFTAHWTNNPDNETSYTNSDFSSSDPDTWTAISCTPSQNSLHTSTMKVSLELAGDSKTTYKAGTVKIYIPAGFYRGLDDNDPLLAACTSAEVTASRLEQLDWMVPKYPEETSSSDFNYQEEIRNVDGQQVKYYVMQNFKDLAGATVLSVIMNYRFRPTMLDVVSEKQPDGSDMGVYRGKYPVFCEVNGDQVASIAMSATVKTQVKPSTATLYKATLDPNKGVYFSWDSTWGTKPADADDYFYVVWYLDYSRNSQSTMPYTYNLSVDPTQMDGGELVGVKKYPGMFNNGWDPDYFASFQWMQPRMYNYGNDYSGIAEHSDLLDTTFVGISNAPTTQKSREAGMLASGYTANDQTYELLIRYPMSKVSDAVKSGIDMEKEGIKATGGFILTEHWQDGTETTRSVGPSGDTSVKALPATGGSHLLEKSNDGTDGYKYGAQTFLLNGNDVVLPDFTIHSDNYDEGVTWDSEAGTYHASNGFSLTDGTYYLYSSSPDYKKPSGLSNIKENDPVALDASDYSYESFYVDDNEYDVAYKEGLGWQRKATASEDYEEYVPIKILCKTAGSADFTEYGTIVRTSKTGYKFVSSDGTQVIDNVSSSNRVSFPEGTVQIKAQQNDSPFYESDVAVHFSIRIHATDHVIDRLKEDSMATSSKNTVFGGFASGNQVVEGKSLGTNDSVGGYWHTVSYELRPVSSWAHLDVGAGVRLDDAQKSERTIPMCVTMQMETSVYDSKYRNMQYLKNYMLDSGTFYCLLPAGTYVNNDEVAVGEISDAFAYWGWNGTPLGTAIRQVGIRSVTQESNWQNSGRTMLIVQIAIPESDRTGRYVDGLRLNFILHNTYTNIVDRGATVGISSMFVNTSGDEVICNSNARDDSYTGSNFSDWKYFEQTAKEGWAQNHEAGTGSNTLDFGTIDILQAGFNVQVSTDQNPSYDSSRSLYLGDGYTDRLQYTAQENARTDSLVLYDVFSPDQENAVGSFESIDVSSIDAKPTYDAATNKTSSNTCKPVVYYATEVPTDLASDLDSGIATGFWKALPDDLSSFDRSSVKAIAIDCRKTDAGSPFVLDRKGTLVAYVHLAASADASKEGHAEKNEAAAAMRTFIGSTPASSDKVTTVTAERTVQLLAPHLSITKTSDPVSGTEGHPAEIGNGADTRIAYTITVRNNAEDASLPDVSVIHVADALPEGLELDGGIEAITVQSGSLGIGEGTAIGKQSAVSCKSEEDGLSFDISHLPSGASVAITVPAIRKDPVESTTTYTNIATIERVGQGGASYAPTGEGDSSSSSTYHRTSVVALPLAGGDGFGGLVSAGLALAAVSAYAHVRRRRKA